MTDFAHADMYLTAVPDAESYAALGAHPQARSEALDAFTKSLLLADGAGRPVFHGTWDALPVRLAGNTLEVDDAGRVASEQLQWYAEQRRALVDGEGDFGTPALASTKQLGVYYYERAGQQWCVGNQPLELEDASGGSAPWRVSLPVADTTLTVDVMLGVRFEMPRPQPQD